MTTICKWGNSLGLRLSKSVVQEAGLKAGASVGVRLLDNGCLLITPHGKAIKVNDELSLETDARKLTVW
ncbi:hypothetical protein [Undibacterium sp. TJN19]|uniref:AbrB/MazE/SpoVT family DNA-binding domain-containing protein n=1 Tax=Undibacterium sp. TJN19 TaxID=3413055 RepID=UPI003BF27B04